VIERSALAKHRARIGRVEEVLVEGPSKKDPGVTSGRTRQNKLVHFVPPRTLRPGTYAEVEITDAAPHHLMGAFRSVTNEAAHKVRIPVSSAS
ncbi:MAG: TRAM domain-containing protein, partial [Acidobacteria bacterium]|nr:TRAM domain-containing protein [Acidobacteriota bacterium]